MRIVNYHRNDEIRKKKYSKYIQNSFQFYEFIQFLNSKKKNGRE